MILVQQCQRQLFESLFHFENGNYPDQVTLDCEEFTGSELMMNDDTGIEENVEIEDEEELYVHALAVICKLSEVNFYQNGPAYEGYRRYE